ncbi:hypothetical protein M2175_005511 [Bradyrhizobium elkanii]|uniref:Uncharacterized protein n=1 Tax=Bradyrhizobium japonicum TaxID=375 RepID=A0A1L3FGD5_BRAJP|nr:MULTISPECIES: hypothetical protein [Bradyrhizobium]APG12373.1 hypothetical protein BKD09_28965 [Bradyrhizobium japonicum]MCS3930480.1 hypothetical protein [Bradyrhizobium elkanii]MCS3971037.1 hypothetical protein [Bradyrhizobium japonicum]
MLATLNSRQIVDEIVKDTVKDNDPHDAIQISPDMVLASRPISGAPALAPEIATRPEPKIDPKFAPEPTINPEPKFSPVLEPQTAAPSVDTAVRVAASDGRNRQKRSSAGKWLRGAFAMILFAGGSAAATVAWEKHGDTARQIFAEWKPALTALTSLLPSTSQTAAPMPAAPVTAAQAAPPAEPAATDQATDQSTQSATPPPVQVAAAAPVATQPDPAQSVQSMTRDLAAMAQQIEALKANIAELKAGQEQMAREMAKPPAPKPVAEAKPVDPRARVSTLPPRSPAPPVRKPKPVVSQTYMPAYSPAPPAPSQAAAVAPTAAPVATTQAVADDDGPVVRPPMPLR